MAAQLPVPNAANMQTAINGMATHGGNIVQEIQAYQTHQQQLATEMTLCGNYNVATIQQQVAQTQQQLTTLSQTVAQTQQQINTLTQNVAQTQQQVAQTQQQVAQTQQQVAQTQQQVAQMQQQVAQTQQTVNQQGSMMSAQFWNLNAKIQNSKVHQITGALVAMRSVDSSPNPQTAINQPIPNFPNTPHGIVQMNAGQCRNILISLDAPIPQGHIRIGDLRTFVREAIGLSAL